MDKLIGVLLVGGLVIMLYLGVFQSSMGGDIQQQGTDVGTSLDTVDPTATANIGTTTN